MIKKLLSVSITAIFLTTSVVNAQQPTNAGFETWNTNGKADGYAGYGDIGLSIGAPTYSFLTTYFKENTVKQSGNSSIRLETKSFPALQGLTLTGFAQLGTFDQNAFKIFGVPYTDRPTSFSGYYKYSPVNTIGYNDDSAAVAVYFTRFDASAGSSNIVGAGEFIATLSTPSMVSFNVPIQWLDYADPDTMYIILASSITQDSATLANHVGSKLWVDDLSFSNFTTGLKQTVTANVATKVGPNPASDFIRLTTSDASIGGTFSVYDVTGKNVKNLPITNFINTFSITDLNEGVYLYQVFDSSNKQVSNGKFSVVR
jgi:hypothetical protein